MKFSKLKKMVKESVREVVREEMKTIIREAVLSEGALSDIIAESVSGVVKGTAGSPMLSEDSQGAQPQQQNKTSQKKSKNTKRLSEKFKKQFGTDITDGVDPAPADPNMPNVNSNSGMPNLTNGANSQEQKIKQLEQQVQNGQMGQKAAAMNQQIPQQATNNTNLQPGVSRMNLGNSSVEKKKERYLDPEGKKQAVKEAKRDKEFINRLKKAKKRRG